MTYEDRLAWLRGTHRELIERKNIPVEGNGIYRRYEYPVITAEHAPLEWRYDLNRETNPFLMERFGIHAAFNAGAIKIKNRYYMTISASGRVR